MKVVQPGDLVKVSAPKYRIWDVHPGDIALVLGTPSLGELWNNKILTDGTVKYVKVLFFRTGEEMIVRRPTLSLIGASPRGDD